MGGRGALLGQGGNRLDYVDGSSDETLSRMQALAAGLADCMAIDVAMTLRKGRLPLAGIQVWVSGERAERPPRSFTAQRVHFRAAGDIRPDRVERTVAMSRQICYSVWHSLRQDIAFETAFEIMDVLRGPRDVGWRPTA